MSNESLIERLLTSCRSYQAGEISLERLASSVELNVEALEGLAESERRQFKALATSLELAQFEYEDEDRVGKARALVATLEERLQLILRVDSAA